MYPAFISDPTPIVRRLPAESQLEKPAAAAIPETNVQQQSTGLVTTQPVAADADTSLTAPIRPEEGARPVTQNTPASGAFPSAAEVPVPLSRERELTKAPRAAFALPFIAKTRKLEGTIDVVYETESGREIKKVITLKKRQDQLKKKLKTLNAMLDCLHEGCNK